MRESAGACIWCLEVQRSKLNKNKNKAKPALSIEIAAENLLFRSARQPLSHESRHACADGAAERSQKEPGSLGRGGCWDCVRLRRANRLVPSFVRPSHRCSSKICLQPMLASI